MGSSKKPPSSAGEKAQRNGQRLGAGDVCGVKLPYYLVKLGIFQQGFLSTR